MKMLLTIRLFFALFVVCGGRFAFGQTNLVGTIAPARILVTMAGQYQHLSKLYYSGEDRPREPREVVVLNFMSLGCAPCRKELPLFLEVLRTLDNQPIIQESGRKVRFYLISTDPLSAKEELRKFLVEQKIDPDREVLLDPYKRASSEFGVLSIPRTFVISPQGRITADIAGLVDDYKNILLTGILTALKE